MVGGPAGIIASAPRGGGVYTSPVGATATTRYTSTSYGTAPSGYSSPAGASSYGYGYSNANVAQPTGSAPYTRGYTSNTFQPASTSYGASGYGGYSNASAAQPTGAAAAGTYATSAYAYDVQRGRQADYDNSSYYTNRVGRSSSHVGTRRTKTPLGHRYGQPEVPSQYNNQYSAAPATSNYGLHRAATPGRLRPMASGTASQWGPMSRIPTNRVTLVLDLDETLVHSCFEPCEADLHIPLVMDGEHYVAYVKKRPYMEQFLARCVELFDVVVWTASLAVYAEPLINELCRLSRCGSVRQMYRESCTQMQDGSYVKDLSTMGLALDDVCILDNSPSVAQLQPKNLIPITSWYDDPNDTCLRDLIPHLDKLASTRSVVDIIPSLPGVRQGFW